MGGIEDHVKNRLMRLANAIVIIRGKKESGICKVDARGYECMKEVMNGRRVIGNGRTKGSPKVMIVENK